MPAIATIGYEGADIQRFISALRTAKIEKLVDVRELPLSRKKGFSKRALADALHAAGIGYVHIRALGDPKPGRVAAKAGKHTEFRRIFDAHMQTDDAKAGLVKCAEIASQNRCALMCFEREPCSCHRAIVADALRLEYGFRVSHIDPIRSTDEPKLRRGRSSRARESCTAGGRAAR